LSAFGLLFLTRDGCGLCEESRTLVTAEAARRGVGLEVVDVDSDPDLRALYGDRVPVVLAGHAREVIAEGRFNRRGLRRALRAL
jgi:hypothetical protein